jgi:hypothetical protein
MMETEVDEEIIFGFKEMSGKIEVDNAGNLDLDVSLLGGNVKTLVLKSEGEDIVSIEANGESFNHLKDQLMEKNPE